MGGSKFAQFINYKVKVTMVDSRMIVGTLLAFDKHMNFVIGDSEEFRLKKSGESKEFEEEKRALGLVILRGENVLTMSVEGPPVVDERRGLANAPSFVPGPGSAVVGGRAMPQIPGAAAPGLTGAPLPGVGMPMGVHPPGGMPFPAGFVPPGMPPMGRGFPPPPPGTGMGTMPPPPGRGMPMMPQQTAPGMQPPAPGRS